MQDTLLTIWAVGIHLCQNGKETTFISVPGMPGEWSGEHKAWRLQDKTDMQLLYNMMHNSETLLKKWYCSHLCTIQAHTGLGIVQIQQNWTRNSKFQWKVDYKYSGLHSVPNQRLKLAPSPDLISYFWSLYYVLFWFRNFSFMEQ